jgi:hypothetical protein
MSTKYIPGKYFTGEPCKNGHVSERWNYNGMCVDCKRSADRNSNKKASKRYQVKSQYGLTMDQVESIKTIQECRCAICKDLFNDTYKTQIDHCHETGKVRGLLCINCNWLLGKSRDTPELLRAAADYLERTKESECLTNL